MNRCASWLGAMLLVSCILFGATAEPAPPNLLVIIADDVGTDKIAAYGEHPRPGRTPHIDALAREGILFRNAYTSPVCSASRANLLTGRHGRRTGVGGIVGRPRDRWELSLSETTLAELLRRGDPDWSTAAIGKWHLARGRTATFRHNPNLQGFEHYAGSPTNLDPSRRGPRRRTGFYAFRKVVDGEVSFEQGTYITTDETNDAIAWLDRVSSPFLLLVGYHAAHAPYHAPPADLLESPVPARNAAPPALYDAALEAMDTEIGRLIASLDAKQKANTLIVFVGDNGTMKEAIRHPWSRKEAKPSLHEGSINVPLVISGAGVGRGEASALVHTVDLFPTLADIAGASTTDLVLDGTSFASVLRDPSTEGSREIVYTERFLPLGPGPYRVDVRAVQDGHFKVLRKSSGERAWFDLRGRHDDGPAIPKRIAQNHGAFERLERELDAIERTVTFDAH